TTETHTLSIHDALPISGGGIERVERAAVHDGSVDREYIAKLESEARSGTPQANFDAALSHHAASMFEMSRGDLEHALSDERTARSEEHTSELQSRGHLV